jgi:hypothetical protein
MAVFALAVVHGAAGTLRLEGTPRSIWLSAAGGISVTYVFLHLLPELAAGQSVMARESPGFLGALEHHAYLVALVGLTFFYGLERAVKLHRASGKSADHGYEAGGKSADRGYEASDGIFWLHMASFSLYNALVGYLLVRNFPSSRELLFFFVAMALHFLVTDNGLRSHHRQLYDRLGRWLLSSSVVLGGGFGLVIEIGELATSVVVAFLGGGIILNVLKEELPEERRSRFSAFLLGGVAYAALLIAS